jgi:hypothetical protein
MLCEPCAGVPRAPSSASSGPTVRVDLRPARTQDAGTGTVFSVTSVGVELFNKHCFDVQKQISGGLSFAVPRPDS